jgi:hypothetical protein
MSNSRKVFRSVSGPVLGLVLGLVMVATSALAFTSLGSVSVQAATKKPAKVPARSKATTKSPAKPTPKSTAKSTAERGEPVELWNARGPGQIARRDGSKLRQPVGISWRSGFHATRDRGSVDLESDRLNHRRRVCHDVPGPTRIECRSSSRCPQNPDGSRGLAHS